MTERNESTILVTGATGNIGNELVKQLSVLGNHRSVRVRAAVRSGIKAAAIKGLGVEVAESDYTKPTTLSKAFIGVDKLFLNTPFQPDMVQLTSNLVAEAAKSGTIEHIVKLSVTGAEAEPGITISRLHREAEKIIEESGIPFTFLRASGFMQNFVNIYGSSIKSQGAFYAPAGDGKIGFIDVRDIASVGVKVLTDDQNDRYNYKAYYLTGPEALSYGEAAEIISKEVGKKISYVNIPDEAARKGMKEVDMGDWFINSIIEMYGIVRAGHGSYLSPNVEELTGKKPIFFSQFAREYADSFK
jgi:uncharacterized protein YbjT (DUF2867 family)